MTPIALAALLLSGTGTITRGPFGVPVIEAPTEADAFYHAGYAVAQDRLWQMETSRRIAKGTMSEVFGSGYVKSDTERLKSGFTDAELRAQFKSTSRSTQAHWLAYARGVNAWIQTAQREGKLPAGYAANGFSPAPWTIEDSAAIAVMMAERFGSGGGYELIQWAAAQYLQTSPGKASWLEVLDDVAPQNDREAITTVDSADEAQSTRIEFPSFTAGTTRQHMAVLPNISLLELMPALGIAALQETEAVAMAHSAPYKMGSYALVVGPSRSKTGKPLLLGAPQMGHQAPSIIHEMTIKAPGLNVHGLNVPGVPGVLVGSTPEFAWTLTTGVADTTDMFVGKWKGTDAVEYGSDSIPVETTLRTLKVKGQEDKVVKRRQCKFGVMILDNPRTGSAIFKLASYRGRELLGFDAFSRIGAIRKVSDIDKMCSVVTLGFNFFFAFESGDVGYRYCGQLPIRASGLDPRLPTPISPQNAWKGYVAVADKVRVNQPKSGLLANWNNKPISWWPNLDTPAWNKLFRNRLLVQQIPAGKLGAEDLIAAAVGIAQGDDDTSGAFRPWIEKVSPLSPVASVASEIRAWDGKFLDGSRGALLYDRFVASLRDELVRPTTGGFLSDSLFSQAIQPSILLAGLEGKSAANYLQGRDPVTVVEAALKRVASMTKPDERFVATRVTFRDRGEMVYSNRGTFIQVVDFKAKSLRTVASPGIAETGDHAWDQLPLAQKFQFKAIR